MKDSTPMRDYTRKAIRGTIVHAPCFGRVEVLPRGYIVVDERGIIEGVYSEKEYERGLELVYDFDNKLILQAMCDMHTHAPQYPMMGLGLDEPLMSWLQTYTYPQEARFQNQKYAVDTYRAFASAMAEAGTTRACVFGTVHVDATMQLMAAMQNKGLSGYVGKVNMDRNCPDELRETADSSIEETLRWLDLCQFISGVKPIITPRFTPACTRDLMNRLGDIVAEDNLPVQSHISESVEEMFTAGQLEPNSRGYWDTYLQPGLWNDKTLMAHCIWSDEDEMRRMHEFGVTAVHCPTSNLNLSSGMCDVRKLLNRGVKVVLGSDVGAGHTLNMLDVMASAIQVSKEVSRRQGLRDPLSTEEVYYLATSAAQEYFGDKPGFAPGNEFHAIVLDDMWLQDSNFLSPVERLQRALYQRDPNWLVKSFAGPRIIYDRGF